MKQWAALRDISFEFITRYTPESNGVSEKNNRLIESLGQTLLAGFIIKQE